MKNNNYKNTESKYWEIEDGEMVEFGNSFMRCYDKAGKLQFGKIYFDSKTGEKRMTVKFAIDRKELLDSKEGAEYLFATIQEWREGYKNGEY